MRDAEAVIEPAFYDHEQDARHAAERRADDWGADAVFASHPRRRFSRRPDDVADGLARRHDGTRGPRPAAGERRASGPVAADHGRSGDARALTHGVEWSTVGVAAPARAEPSPDASVEPVVDRPLDTPLGARRDRSAAAGSPAPAPGAEESAPGGRRTVVITGRPADRRRPPRRPEERLGSRPDRVAGWAFGMGLVLIAVAAVPL